MNFDAAFNNALASARGFLTNDKNYNSVGQFVGNKFGLGALDLETFFKDVPTKEDIEELTASKAKQVYKTLFWDKINGDLINNADVAKVSFNALLSDTEYGLNNIRNAINKTVGDTVVELRALPLTIEETELLNNIDKQLFIKNMEAQPQNDNNTVTIDVDSIVYIAIAALIVTVLSLFAYRLTVKK